MCVKNFISADAVCSETFGAYIFQKSPFYIGLDGVMYLYLVLLSKFRHVIYCLLEKLHIVVVERCSYLVQMLYCIDIQHNILLHIAERLLTLENREKTLAKITKKSVFSQNDIH